MHVEDHVDALLARPADHLGHAVEVRGRVGARRGLELAPVEDQADHVEAEGAHLREVVAAPRCGGLRVGRQARPAPRTAAAAGSAPRPSGSARRRPTAPPGRGPARRSRRGRRRPPCPTAAAPVQQHLAPGGVGQVGRQVGAARRRHDVEEGQRRDRRSTAELAGGASRGRRRERARRGRRAPRARRRGRGRAVRARRRNLADRDPAVRRGQPAARPPLVGSPPWQRLRAPGSPAGSPWSAGPAGERRRGRGDGLALRGPAHDPRHPALHRRARPRRGAARHPLRRHPGPERVEPPALPLRRPHRRAGGPRGQAAARRGGPHVLGRQAGGRRLRQGVGRRRRLPEVAHGPHHAALRRHLRVRARADPGLLRALPPHQLHGRRLGLPRLPERAPGRPRPRLRRRHDGLAVRRGRRAAGAAAHPRRGRAHGDHHHRPPAGAPRPGAPAPAPRAGLRRAVGGGPRLGGRPGGGGAHGGGTTRPPANTVWVLRPPAEG